MFNKQASDKSGMDSDAASKPELKVREDRKREVSVIGPTVHFKGELSANEDLLIEGRIEGYIAHQEKNLTVGREGKIKADIHANAVEVFGEVEGDIKGDELVRLAKSAKVTGNIRCPRIVVEDGASFSGHVDMSGDKASQDKKKPTPSLVSSDTGPPDSTSVGA